MAFEFTIEQKAADEILDLTKKVKNFKNHAVSQGNNENATINQSTNNEFPETSLDDRSCCTEIQDKRSGNVDNNQRKGSDESDQGIDISKYENISISNKSKIKYKTFIREENSGEKNEEILNEINESLHNTSDKNTTRLSVPEKNYEKLKIVDIKRGGVEGGAIIEWKDGKKYMLKGLYKEKGKYLYKPNAKNSIHAFFTREGIDGINKSVIEEYVALKLANVVYKGISPDVKLGKIEHKDNKGGDCKYQYCLMTEMAGQKKEEGETFSTLEKFFEENKNTEIAKEIWQNAFAVSVCLLNDRDVNKTDNIGVVYKDEKATKLSLFDLGHPTPDKYELDPKTLLPESMNVLEKVALWIMNLFVKTSGLPWTFKMNYKIIEQLGEEDRADAIRNLLDKKDKIIEELENIAKEFGEEFGESSIENAQVIRFKEKIKNRFRQLGKVLVEYNSTHPNSGTFKL